MSLERIQTLESQISENEFEQILPKICDADISSVPERWTHENPLCSTCVPVSLVARRIFGGKLLRADLKPFPKFSYMKFHWANLLPGGRVKDFTWTQFGDDYPKEMKFILKSPSFILRIPGFAHRVDLLYERWLKEAK